VRFKVSAVEIGESIETFTIEFNHLRDESAMINLIWDKTVVPLKLEVALTDKIVAQIDAVMASADKKSAGFYFQAATFYYNHDLDLNKALGWVNTGLEGNPNIAFEIMYLKAEILAKQGNKADAIAAAKQSSELSIKAQGADNSFVKMNADLIASLQ
jgi:hypothetical protein